MGINELRFDLVLLVERDWGRDGAPGRGLRTGRVRSDRDRRPTSPVRSGARVARRLVRDPAWAVVNGYGSRSS